MKKIFAILLCCAAFAANAQVRSVTGTVTSDDDGAPVSGVMVSVQGTGTIAITDALGEYAIQASEGDVLVFNLLGYAEASVAVGSQSVINMVLTADATQIDEVVVTALGIVRKEKSLTYATSVLGGEELTRVKDPNLINSLAGKTAGVQINRSSSGLGGSARVLIRGYRSSDNNSPLYVIDGVPIGGSNSRAAVTSTITGNNNNGNRDAGDMLSTINPDDIESMNILKGPSAAALYGSSAANGVVLITTKKGVAGRTEVTFNSNTTWDNAVYGRPELQNSYTGVAMSWGSKINGSPDYMKKFFKTGLTTINSISLSSGNDKMQTYFSYANTYGKGVIEGNEMTKHNFTFRETAKFFNDRLTVDANVNMTYQTMENLTTPGGFYMNPLVGLYRFPRGGVEGGESFDYYKENYKIFNSSRNMYLQNWYVDTSANTWEANPFWLINMDPSEDYRFRTLANLSLSLKISDHFTLQARGRADFNASNFEQRFFAGTTPALTTGQNGRLSISSDKSIGVYGDLILSYQQSWDNWSVSATLGSSIEDGRGWGQSIESYGSGLAYPNDFRVQNIIAPRVGSNKWRGSQNQAVFFAGQVGYKDFLFLDVTARNDWTSTMAYTDYEKSGFFYPSFGASWLLDQSLNMPDWVSLGKVRASWAQVGNGLPGGVNTNPVPSVPISAYPPTVGRPSTTAPAIDLRPEKVNSFEVGTEWRLFNSRLEFDFTYYQTHTLNQAFNIGLTGGTGYTSRWVNAGDIKNEGIEIMLGGTPVWSGNFMWRTGFNFSMNKNEVLELVDGVDSPLSFGGGGSNNYEMRYYVGGSLGDIYGKTFMRDEAGNIKYGEDGLPLPDAEEGLKKMGDVNPDFLLGWQNTFTWKGLSLYILIDGRFGGDVLSMTMADLDQYGVSKQTGIDRDRGYVSFDGRQIEDVRGFYTLVGGRAGITEHYLYDATNIRLRELSIGYSLPRKWFSNAGWIKGADISLIGRNLFFFMNNAPYDPDAVLSTGNGLQGVDAFGMPSMRSFGFNIKLNF